MNKSIPSIADVRAALDGFRHAELQKLAKLSGLPYMTIYKIQTGATPNPGLETVRKFAPHIKACAPKLAPVAKAV